MIPVIPVMVTPVVVTLVVVTLVVMPVTTITMMMMEIANHPICIVLKQPRL
jgi:hypothetical protein